VASFGNLASNIQLFSPYSLIQRIINQTKLCIKFKPSVKPKVTMDCICNLQSFLHSQIRLHYLNSDKWEKTMTYWFITALKKYAIFSGRARRKEYWYFILISLLIYSLLAIIENIYISATMDLIPNLPLGIISNVFALLILCPTLAVTTRRLHDTNRSGWWQLVYLIPIVGIVIMLILTSEDSVPYENQYGRNPKGRAIVVFY
jgi:uncharacterized membrane protein YhaH (DUF805 family)